MTTRALAVGALTACLLSGCSSTLPGYPPSASSAEARPSAMAATATRGGELGALSARGVVNALVAAGFQAPNAVDTTAQECPASGCEQSVVTDTVRVKSFGTTARAQNFAAARDLFQLETIVVEFAPPLSEQDRARYRAELEVLVR
ncbi:hypothetical protein [Mycobacterium sp. AT1]|uniref:hypothetical protein n=1 Tax=Mycobacterium sp. AT1 TaxID=1961706 RepID=UPI001153CDA4|nr:hypothetical protein [Mycobacterium sp. AT1]